MNEGNNISRDEKNGFLIFRMAGEIDSLHVDSIRPQLENAAFLESRPIILNMQAVRFIDSSGLGVIMNAFKRLKSRGENLYLCNVPANIMASIENMGLNNILMLYEEEEDLIRSLLETPQE